MVVRSRAASSTSAGLNFQFTDEQRELQMTTRDFMKNEIIPVRSHHDKTGEYLMEVFKKAHACGLVNAEIPTAYGGLGIDTVSSVLMGEEFGYGCSGIATAMLTNELAEAPLIIGASEETKKKYLGRMIDEPLMASYCVTEPNAGSDVAGIRTKCERKGDEWILNGSKMWITNGGVANWFFVLAKNDPKASTGNAFTAFVIDGDSPGVTRGKKEINIGQRASDTRGITFEDVRVPSCNVIGAPGEGIQNSNENV
ncbi:hypothetical protein AB6A40_009474 [Gnathostoma spinigerum]|uniref:Medium-chain specific acyl-CoA dehydrogenase, mitochondrial n=1 Tax=Gnathostoma spinigerum TaxID=75299 RepID=A0ABD6ETB5_9BILA